MAFDMEEIKFLSDNFQGLHGKIDGVQTEITKTKTAFKDHVKNPCPNITNHWTVEHKGLIGKIIIILVAALGLLFGIFQYFFG